MRKWALHSYTMVAAAFLVRWSAGCTPSGGIGSPWDATPRTSDSGSPAVQEGVIWVVADHLYLPDTPPGMEAGIAFALFGASVVWVPDEQVLEKYEEGGCLATRTVGSIAYTGVGDSVGTLTIAGLSPEVGGTLEIDPWCPAPDYECSYVNYTVSAPVTPGAMVAASAPGKDLPGFSLSARVPNPLVLTSPNLADAQAASDLGVVPGLPFAVTWEPGDGDWIRVILSTPDAAVVGTINCWVGDTGELVIPAEATELLADLGPTSLFEIERVARSAASWVGLMVGYREAFRLQ